MSKRKSACRKRSDVVPTYDGKFLRRFGPPFFDISITVRMKIVLLLHVPEFTRSIGALALKHPAGKAAPSATLEHPSSGPLPRGYHDGYNSTKHSRSTWT